VFKTRPGLYEWIVTVDFNSLYPSIMIGRNLCFSTIPITPAAWEAARRKGRTVLEIDVLGKRKVPYVQSKRDEAGNVTDRCRSIIPVVLEGLLEKRGISKKDMASAEKLSKVHLGLHEQFKAEAAAEDDPHKKLLKQVEVAKHWALYLEHEGRSFAFDAKQTNQKKMANSVYGAFGAGMKYDVKEANSLFKQASLQDGMKLLGQRKSLEAGIDTRTRAGKKSGKIQGESGYLACIPIAASVTASGRSFFPIVEAAVDAADADPLAGDTDSMMIKFRRLPPCPSESDVAEFNAYRAMIFKKGETLAAFISSQMPKPIKLECEKVAYKAIMVKVCFFILIFAHKLPSPRREFHLSGWFDCRVTIVFLCPCACR